MKGKFLFMLAIFLIGITVSVLQSTGNGDVQKSIIEWIIGAIIAGIIADIVWETLRKFLTSIIKSVLPNKYGEKVEKTVKKIMAIVRKVYGAVADITAYAKEFGGYQSYLGEQSVEWSEVPSDIKQQIESKGEYCYERSI